MIHSFLKFNSTFKGKIIILHNQLSIENQNILKNFPNIIFHSISKNLKLAVDILTSKSPNLKHKKNRFYSLELFNLNTNSNILFCDSDILFNSNISEIFEEKEKVLVCAEYIQYLGYSRDKTTFDVVFNQNDKNNLNKTFNAGLIYLPKHFVSQIYFKKTLEYLDYKFWQNIKEPYTDQIVFNKLLENHTNFLPITYNCLLNRRKELNNFIPKNIKKIKVLHFNGAKPWSFKNYFFKIQKDIVLLKFFKLWQENYTEAFQYLSIKEQTKDKI
ncbi:MAG: glycosyltransferase [Halarcobacter sp.]